jgi:predicted ATPase
MRELPGGTVTFLFTDIEGSTRLLHDLGDAYADVLAEHRRVLREAFERHGGVEVDTQGDAFFVAFARASDALAAAREGQEALAPGGVRVRMGLHTGEPMATAEGYVGLDVHRAARIAAAGHGGQILVSQSTRELTGLDALRDLGEYHLKDLAAPERIYQLGDGDFPPLKSLNIMNLPLSAEPLLGRKKELLDVLRLVGVERARVVTITGPGGIGKTRFALEAAAGLVEDFSHGVWFVGLAPLRDPELVVPTIASTLGARKELRDHIGERELLLLLDNFEQIVDAATDVAELLAACANLVVLVTSREPLHIAGEREYQLLPLPESPGVELFRQRASAVVQAFDADYAELAEICRRLDSLPLAIELAAARVKLLPPATLLARLDTRLPLLTSRRRDAEERHRTLRATIEWSYDLLSEDERCLFARLAAFAGSFDADAAEQVCDADVDILESLVDKSLLRQTGDGRFFILETIREFALERLRERTDVRSVKRRHALYYLALAERAEARLRGPDQQRWLERLERDHDNLRAALSWSQEGADIELGLRLAAALWRFWRMHNHLAEGARALDVLLHEGEAAPASLRARVLLGASRLALDEGHFGRSIASAEEALAAARTSGAAWEIAAATENLGVSTFVTGATTPALALLEDSIVRFRALGDPIGTADALNNLGNAMLDAGQTERARKVLEEALALQREAKNAWGVEFVLHTLGYVALYEGELKLARERLEESLLLSQAFGHLSGIGWSLEGLAHIAAANSEDRRAIVLWAAGQSIRSEAGVYMQPSEAAIHEDALSLVQARLGEAAAAAAWAEGATLAPDDAVACALLSQTSAPKVDAQRGVCPPNA